jgi:hypothetical protein
LVDDGRCVRDDPEDAQGLGVAQHRSIGVQDAGLQLMLQDMLLSSDRLSASVSTLIQAALGVLDEATNDGIPGPPVLFLRFTEEVLRTHGFTGQALRLQKFTDEVLRTHGFTKQSLKR